MKKTLKIRFGVLYLQPFIDLHLSRKTEGIGPLTSWQPLQIKNGANS